MDEQRVAASGNAARARAFGTSMRLDAVYDAPSGEYFMPNVEPRDRVALFAPIDDRAPRVAIVDTGVLENHPLLQPRIAAVRDFTGAGATDQDGHGTEVAITLVLDAPDVRLLSAKVLADDDAPVAEQADRIAQGIGWVVSEGAREINVCVGFLTACGPDHRSLCAAVRQGLDRGVFILVAGEAVCPATCDGRCLAIGELEPDGRVRSNIPPTFVEGTWGRIERVPWNEWARTQRRESNDDH